MNVQSSRMKSQGPRSLKQSVILFASLFPVAILLIVGSVGTEQIGLAQANIFLLALLLSAVSVFGGEYILLVRTRRVIAEQYAELTAACQEYLNGMMNRRASLSGNNELAILINTLLEQTTMVVQQEYRPLQKKYARLEEQLQNFHEEIEQLLTQLSPVVEGDLRTTIAVPAGDVGLVTSVCNLFIEEIVQLVRWSRHAAGQVIDSSRELFDYALGLAKITENQMSHLASTTTMAEQLASSLQRIGRTLPLSMNLAQATLDQLSALQSADGTLPPSMNLAQTTLDQLPVLQTLLPAGTPSQNEQRAETLVLSDDPLAFLLENERRQKQFLAEMGQVVQETTLTTQTIIQDLYTFAQHIHQSSADLFKNANEISALASLAERWGETVNAFRLPPE